MGRYVHRPVQFVVRDACLSFFFYSRDKIFISYHRYISVFDVDIPDKKENSQFLHTIRIVFCVWFDRSCRIVPLSGQADCHVLGRAFPVAYYCSLGCS